MDKPGDTDPIQQEMELSAELREFISARDSFLTQKAKIQWPIEGDLNTSYFYHVIKKRNMLNKVFQIEDHRGMVCTKEGSIQTTFLNYYQELLGTRTDIDCVNQAVVRRGICYSDEHWVILARPVTIAEVKQSIFSIPKNKSPGPNGYNSQFYRDAWDVIGDEICAAIMNFFDTGQLLAQVNTTVVTLIPKVERPTSVKHFRPISCCNLLYKAISKILCSRLPLILPELISRSQGAIVKGRSIQENILICQDLVRGMVMTCVTTTSYSLNLNGSHGALVFQVTSSLALSTFSVASGIKVNADKSKVVFNGIPDWLRSDITHISGFQEGTLPFKYMGVPVQPGRLTRHDCNILIEKIVIKIRGIGAKKLSYAGRLVLINSVLNTLHNYWSSIFVIPKGVVKRIEAICRNFLWSSDEVYHRTPLVAWDKVCCTKKEGRLGIHEAGVWNIATIGKLVNWIYTKADRLWALWIDHIYLKGRGWNAYQPSLDSNWNWRNVCRVKDALAGGFQDNQWVVATRGYSLIQREALNPRAKLLHLGLCTSDQCVLCERGVETRAHIFSECDYNSQIIVVVEQRLKLKLAGAGQIEATDSPACSK
ncbi:uncharacterized protein LOC141589929 [Silene latifolia]|uniref:uncharacterized protein LOC141589929 n=1 Tax=Silene latifolia TaxID=37657 RepID=UPI003D76EC31